MSCHVKLFKKVPIVIISHLILVTAVVPNILFLELLNTVQLVIENFTESLINLAIWADRKESNYLYDPNRDSILQTRLRRQQRNKPNNWETVISEKWAMCKKAIVGQEVKHNDNRNKGLKIILIAFSISMYQA